MESVFEYGISLKDDTSDLHRSGMTNEEAQEWIRDWVQMSGRTWPFPSHVDAPRGDACDWY